MVCLMILNWKIRPFYIKSSMHRKPQSEISGAPVRSAGLWWHGPRTGSKPQPSIVTRNSPRLRLDASRNTNYCASRILIVANVNCDMSQISYFVQKKRDGWRLTSITR